MLGQLVTLETSQERRLKMTGNKPLIASVLIFVLALIYGGIYQSSSFLMSLADTSLPYMVLRGGVAVLLVILLLSKPPRSYLVRMTVGIASVVLATLSIGMLYSYEVRVFDAVVFLEVAIIFALEALEVRTIHVKEKYLPPKKINVRTA